jgi:cell division septal protein FtsQ
LDKLDQAVAGSMLEVEQIDLSKPRELVMTTTQHTVVKVDVEDFPQQLRRLGAILRWAQQRQKSVQIVDLTVNRGVPVTFN